MFLRFGAAISLSAMGYVRADVIATPQDSLAVERSRGPDARARRGLEAEVEDGEIPSGDFAVVSLPGCSNTRHAERPLKLRSAAAIPTDNKADRDIVRKKGKGNGGL